VNESQIDIEPVCADLIKQLSNVSQVGGVRTDADEQPIILSLIEGEEK
jgi:hypothetical protein